VRRTGTTRKNSGYANRARMMQSRTDSRWEVSGDTMWALLTRPILRKFHDSGVKASHPLRPMKPAGEN
jgi:hypothetical protein